MNWLITVAIKAVLEWLTSLLVRLQEKAQLRQEGREQVKDELDKDHEESKKEVEAVIAASPTTLDPAIERMRRRSQASGDYKE